MNNTIGLVNGVPEVLEDDAWRLVEDDQTIDDLCPSILTLARWQELQDLPAKFSSPVGVLLDPDDDPSLLVPWIDSVALIALQFPGFKDGRAYSQANLLRTRYGFKGDLRAVGDVLRDQLMLMRHCGFSSFAVREDKPVADALKGLQGFDMIYARSVANPEPLFRRRQGPEIHGSVSEKYAEK